jgi:tRNA1Val (adenine37-N6)-methyltransferase
MKNTQRMQRKQLPIKQKILPNKYFQFKKFTVQQENSDMKVCTDSCLFGAWVANKIQQKIIQPKTILDIGTGTGLLSLMLAQKSSADIDAVDIDEASCDEAGKNFDASPWSQRLQVFHSDIKKWAAPHPYNLIICNPPFYENDLLPKNSEKTISRHSTALLLEELLMKVKKLLSKKGYFAVLVPYQRSEWFLNIAKEHSLYVDKQMQVRQSTKHHYFRSMLILQLEQRDITKNELSIKDNGNEYTKEFIDLLKDYYLYL